MMAPLASSVTTPDRRMRSQALPRNFTFSVAPSYSMRSAWASMNSFSRSRFWRKVACWLGQL
jgi:hypothetical protein